MPPRATVRGIGLGFPQAEDTTMTEYLVNWSIDIEADSPEQAAQKALAIQRNNDPANLATVFKVSPVGSDETIEIDLSEVDGNEQFDDAIDDATHAVLAAFGDFSLPSGDELSGLMVRLNDAIAAIMQDYR
jgi:hypothetical protein